MSDSLYYRWGDSLGGPFEAICTLGHVELNLLLSQSDYISFHSPAYSKVVSKKHLCLIPDNTSIIITTLGLPFFLSDFIEWREKKTNCKIIFDLCSGKENLDVLKKLPGVEIKQIYAARTQESIERAEKQMLENINEYRETK